ncbi:MAG: 3-hydroxyacyl-ACP dehydratase FabZ [Buchnera aphidicola (Chaetogeoica yunlongensis)]
MYNFENKDIIQLLPHKYPFLFVDKIVKYKKNNNISTIKNVSYSDFCFMGHFYDNPVFPGVLVLESIAQTACLLVYKSFNISHKNSCLYLTNVHHTVFKKKVFPGDQMLINVSIDKIYRKLIYFSGVVSVNNIIVCKSSISCMLK